MLKTNDSLSRSNGAHGASPSDFFGRGAAALLTTVPKASISMVTARWWRLCQQRERKEYA